jgi:hypothetical protein
MRPGANSFCFWLATTALVCGLALQPHGIVAAALFAAVAAFAVVISLEG